jgi:hypothetical protein
MSSMVKVVKETRTNDFLTMFRATGRDGLSARIVNLCAIRLEHVSSRSIYNMTSVKRACCAHAAVRQHALDELRA